MDYVKQAKSLMGAEADNGSISIPRWALMVTGGDYALAVFIKQVWFWSQHATDPDGFYRSYATWEREDYLTRSQVNRGRDWVGAEIGEDVLVTVIKKPRGKDGNIRGSAPMLHWNLDVQEFCIWICKKLTGRCVENQQVDVHESDTSMCKKAASPPVGNQQVDVQESSRTIYMNQDRESNRDSRQEESDSDSDRERDSVDPDPTVEVQESPQKILSLFGYSDFLEKFYQITGRNPKLKVHQDEVHPLAVELWAFGYRIEDLDRTAKHCAKWMTTPPHPNQVAEYIEASKEATQPKESDDDFPYWDISHDTEWLVCGECGHQTKTTPERKAYMRPSCCEKPMRDGDIASDQPFDQWLEEFFGTTFGKAEVQS